MFLFKNFILCACVFGLHVSLGVTCVSGAWEIHKRARDHLDLLIDGYELPRWCWELTLRHLKEEKMFLAIVSSLQPPQFYFKYVTHTSS